MAENEPSEGILNQISDTDWRPIIPLAVLVSLYILFMPSSGNPSFWSLELHQQLIGVSAMPTVIGSFYWFITANDLNKTKSPEERILEGDGDDVR